MSHEHAFFLLFWIGIAVLALVAGLASVWSHSRRMMKETPTGLASSAEEARTA